jgi:hypothetical protein
VCVCGVGGGGMTFTPTPGRTICDCCLMYGRIALMGPRSATLSVQVPAENSYLNPPVQSATGRTQS